MRISSKTFFESNVTAMSQQQARLLQTQQQVSSGRRVLTASDDPVAAARALEVSQSDAMNTQQASNRLVVRDSLSLAESALQRATYLLQDVRTAAINAGNGTLNDGDRRTIATEMSGRLQELIGIANSTDGGGNHLFGGFQSRAQPFVDVSGVISYNGDDGQRNMQVSATRQMASSNSGADVFMRVKNGNGTFVTQAASGNSGSGVVSLGNVSNSTLLTGHNYQIDFTVAAGITTYSVTDNSTLPAPTVLSAGNPYVSGQTINFDGMQFDIQGAPANGDRFTVSPSANESVFKTISDLITALNTAVPSGGMASLTNSLDHGLNQLDNALDVVLTTRSSLGLRMNEVDALQSAGEDLSLQFKQTLSELQDVDYSKALSDLVQQQTFLEAAQKSFARVASLSMFDYL